MVGKTAPIFPMIGKIIRPFSNDWKNFSRKEAGEIPATKDTKSTKEEGRNAGGMREKEIYKNISNPASRT